MKKSLSSIISNVDKLISFPAVANQLISLIDNDSTEIEDIASVIQNDPALTASLLKIANSAWFMAREPATSIETAVIRIGLNEIGRIALNICIQDSFKDIPENLLSLSDYFDHSLRAAFASQETAKRHTTLSNGTMYTAGLLHDIGQLILLNLYPNESSEALAINIAEYNGQNLHVVEKQVFGVDHTQVGLALAKKWNFPPLLQDCIRHHHTPEQSSNHLEVSCIHIANAIAIMNEFEGEIDDLPDVNPSAITACQLDDEKILALAATSKKLFNENKEKTSIE